MDSALAEIGSTANSYQVLARLATGGMAEIFLARSAGVAAVQRYVVLKRVLRDRATDIHFVRMFLDEARLASQLQHANIAQVFDVGKLGDSYFFTMEYVHGETVRSMLHQAHVLRRSPPLGCVLAIAAGAAAGLHHAHTRIGMEGRPLGIVHRDVSPSNLMISFDGSVKVVDFGVAKAADRIQETHSGAVKGKISYLSPEQARGGKLDQRSDLFALGIVMWEMLTVERLYKHASDFATMTAIINEPTPPPSSRRRDLPPELDALVLRALAKSPEDRFQSAEELGEAIEQVAVQTSSPLSAAGLARFLRELFGHKPEPWIALQTKEERPEIVTVTSEPIPAELKIPISDPVDRRLAAVVDLSVAPADFAGAEVSAVTATPAAAVGEVTAVTTTSRALAVASAKVMPSPTAAGSASDGEAPRWRAARVRIALGLGAVLVIAVIVAVAVALSSSELPPTAATDSIAPPPRQTQVAAGPSVTPIAIVDAAAPEVDAEVVAVAEPPPVVDAPAAAPPPRPRASKPPRPARPTSSVAKELAARRYADAVAECTANPSADRALCVRAACLAGDAKKARDWLARLPAAQRASLTETCAALAPAKPPVPPPPPAKPDCADPMDCPR